MSNSGERLVGCFRGGGLLFSSHLPLRGCNWLEDVSCAFKATDRELPGVRANKGLFVSPFNQCLWLSHVTREPDSQMIACRI